MDTWLLACVVVGLLAVGARALMRHAERWKPWLSAFSVGIGLMCSITMLLLALMLTGKLWADTRIVVAEKGSLKAASAAPASAPVGPADAADNGKDAIANAMTAIGTVVAVVALILSVGTTWFAQQLEKLDHAMRDLGEHRLQLEKAAAQERANLQERERAVEAVRSRQARLERRTCEARDALIGAKWALAEWVDRVGSEAAFAYITSWTLQLEMLTADDLQIRFSAFSALTRALAPYDEGLTPVRNYSELCHALVLERLSHLEHGEAQPAHVVLGAVESGLWCKIFDEVERARWQRAISGG